MANEIIKLLEYITGNPLVQGVALVYVIIYALVALLAGVIIIGTFITVIKRFRRRK